MNIFNKLLAAGYVFMALTLLAIVVLGSLQRIQAEPKTYNESESEAVKTVAVDEITRRFGNDSLTISNIEWCIEGKQARVNADASYLLDGRLKASFRIYLIKYNTGWRIDKFFSD